MANRTGASRVRETSITTSGAIQLAGAVSGFRTFASAHADGDLVWVVERMGNDFQTLDCTFNATANTLTINNVIESYIGGVSTVYPSATANTWAAGSKEVYEDLPGPRAGFQVVPLAASQNFNSVLGAGSYSTIDVNSINAPLGPAAGASWYLFVEVYAAYPTTYVCQTATRLDIAGAATFTRSLVGGAWGAWQQQIPPSLIRGYIDGLILSTGGSSNYFSVAPGVANDSTNATTMALASTLQKAATTAWSAGNNGGSLDTGTIATNTGYHVYLIQNPTSGAVDVIISLAAGGPTLPSGYTLARRIGWIKIDSSSNVLKFTQFGDDFIWAAPVTDISLSGSFGTTPALYTMSVPSGVKVTGKFRADVYNGSAVAFGLLTSPDENSGGAYSPAGNGNMGSWGSSLPGASELSIRTNASGQIRAVSYAAGNNLYVVTIGWTDRRGRDS